MNPDLVSAFNAWVDRILALHASERSVAYNFNLYEHETAFAVQIAGASRFRPED